MKLSRYVFICGRCRIFPEIIPPFFIFQISVPPQVRTRNEIIPLCHVSALPEDFPGDRPEGAAAFVKAVRSALNVRFRGGSAPRVLFTDRGSGFYNAGTGRMTDEYRSALCDHGLQAFQGESAAVQPGKLSDLLLHETAVSWIRFKERTSLPARPWEESSTQLLARLKRIVASINAEHDVAGLCRSLPSRINTLEERGGGKLGK